MPNDHNTPPSDALLDRYLAGSLTPDERRHVDTYCAMNPRYATALEVLRTTAAQSGAHPPMSATHTLPTLLARMDDASAVSTSRAPKPRSQRWYLYGTFAAAAAIAVVFLGRPTSRVTQVPTTVYQTGTGERATINLADGSRVILGPQTTLTVPKQLGAESRRGRDMRAVSLVGEAQFDVTSRQSMPFVVRTGGVETRVLGTRFVVQRYAEDATAIVEVMSGRVSAGAREKAVLLSAGMRAELTDSSTVAVESRPASNAASWVDGRLEFVDAPVPVMLATLKRWYGYEFRLDDSTLVKRHVNIAFKVDDRAETLHLLKELLGVSMTFKGSTVILSPAPAGRVKRSSKLLDEGKMISTRAEVGR